MSTTCCLVLAQTPHCVPAFIVTSMTNHFHDPTLWLEIIFVGTGALWYTAPACRLSFLLHAVQVQVPLSGFDDKGCLMLVPSWSVLAQLHPSLFVFKHCLRCMRHCPKQEVARCGMNSLPWAPSPFSHGRTACLLPTHSTALCHRQVANAGLEDMQAVPDVAPDVQSGGYMHEASRQCET